MSALLEKPRALCLEQILKPLDCQTGIADHSAHRVGVDRIVAWNGDNADAVGHHGVLAFANDSEPGLFKRANRLP